jgi:D-alanyl-D-alanine dipeptidase
MKYYRLLLVVVFLLGSFLNKAYALPDGFLYLHDVDQSILQEIRYASDHNFVGRKIKGYEDNVCILTKEAALALAKVQVELRQLSLALKVYDCYRPKSAVDDFIVWSQDKKENAMKAEFYPNVYKANLFTLQYIAKKSGHSRGSTIDLTIVPLPTPKQSIYHPKDKLIACTAPYQERLEDNSINMGTGYDCLDKLSHMNKSVSADAIINRKLLRKMMEKYHFIPYSKEWWHFTLKEEPYPHTYFDFPVKKNTRPFAKEEKKLDDPEKEKFVLTLADIHFDPFLSCSSKNRPCPLIQKLQFAPISEWGRLLSENERAFQYMEDSGFALVKSALMAAKVEAEKRNVQFVLILGDFLGHDFKRKFKAQSRDPSSKSYQQFVNKVIGFLTTEIEKAFPYVDVYAVIGNNDTYQRDYQSTPDGPFFKDVARWWSSLIKTKVNRTIAQKEIANAGYYAVTIQGAPLLRLIVLNTNLFSDNAKGSATQKAALEQLNWLTTELKSAKGKQQKVFIAMHIPEGIDIYGTKHLRLFRVLDLWKNIYTERFQKILAEFSTTITGIFAGHLHLDWSQQLSFKDGEIMKGETPSISPIFGNNPGFKIYQFSPQSFKVRGYATHYYYPLNKNQVWSSSSAK